MSIYAGSEKGPTPRFVWNLGALLFLSPRLYAVMMKHRVYDPMRLRDDR